jgi:hypothetical protein
MSEATVPSMNTGPNIPTFDDVRRSVIVCGCSGIATVRPGFLSVFFSASNNTVIGTLSYIAFQTSVDLLHIIFTKL